jgi:hypothetical protein
MAEMGTTLTVRMPKEGDKQTNLDRMEGIKMTTTDFCFPITRYMDENGEYHVEGGMGRIKVAIDIVDVEYRGHWEDFGIGHYEYWGIRGYDSRMGFVADDIECACDKDGNDWTDELTESEIESLKESCAENNKENYEEYSIRMRREEEPPRWKTFLHGIECD